MELLKQRLIGAMVLFSLAIIFLPEIFSAQGAPHFFAENSTYETLPYQQALTEHAAQATVYKVANTVAAITDTEVWSVRVGAFSDVSVAEHLVQKLQQQGYTTYTQLHDGNLYHVFVGPELDASNAQTVQQRLKQHLGLNGVVVPYEPVLYAQNSNYS